MTDKNNERDKNDDSFYFILPEDLKEEFSGNTDNMAEALRWLMRSYNEVEDRYEVGDDMKEINVILLRTYRNAIEQNIQLLKHQRDKIDEELEKVEESDDEVLVEIDLDIAEVNL